MERRLFGDEVMIGRGDRHTRTFQIVSVALKEILGEVHRRFDELHDDRSRLHDGRENDNDQTGDEQQNVEQSRPLPEMLGHHSIDRAGEMT